MKVPEPIKLPSGNYFIRMRLGGVSVPVTRPTAKECKRAAELIKAEHRANKRPVSASEITLVEAIDNYIKIKSNVLSPSTIRGYEMIKKHRFSDYADKPLKNVDWQAAVNREAAGDVSAKTLKNAWGLIASVHKANGLPVPSVTLPQLIANEREWLTPEQIPVFLSAVKGKPCEFPALLCLHGLRRSEIYALTASSFSGGIIHVRGAVVRSSEEEWVKKETNKNTTSRRDVPIMIPRLQELIDSGEPMFRTPITHLSASIENVCKSAGLPIVSAHGLRHSFASAGYHAGLSELQMQKLGGWADAQTMRKIYTHISKADMESAADKLKNFFANENANESEKM